MRIFSFGPAMLSACRHVMASVLALALALLATVPASAQLADQVDASLLETWRLRTGNVIRFCQYDSAPSFAFDRAVAEDISQRLLVASEYQVLDANYAIGGEFAAEDLFVTLTNECDVMMGMGAAANLYPAEFITTRSYVGFSYVLATTDPDIEGLTDIGPGQRLGAQVGSYGFRTLVRYAATLRQDRRFIALPYANTQTMVARLLDGTISAMIIFGPSLVHYLDQAEQGTDLLVRPLDTQLAATVGIAGLTLARNAYLRSLIDQVIGDMVSDGTIDALVQEAGFDAMPYAAGGIQ